MGNIPITFIFTSLLLPKGEECGVAMWGEIIWWLRFLFVTLQLDRTTEDMKKSIFSVMGVMLVACMAMSCQKGKTIAKVENDSIVSKDSLTMTDDSTTMSEDSTTMSDTTCYVSVYKKPLGNGQYRDFFITCGEYCYRFKVYDSSKDKYYDIDFYAEDYLNEGVPGMSGFASPDGRYVYVVGDILANSTGWISTLIIYQVDTKTLKAELVNGVAAWKMEKDGFTVASETRCTTPDAECSAAMDFAFEDITYGFDGKIKHKSKEYPSKEIKMRYGKDTNAVKGLGVVRHSYFD